MGSSFWTISLHSRLFRSKVLFEKARERSMKFTLPLLRLLPASRGGVTIKEKRRTAATRTATTTTRTTPTAVGLRLLIMTPNDVSTPHTIRHSFIFYWRLCGILSILSLQISSTLANSNTFQSGGQLIIVIKCISVWRFVQACQASPLNSHLKQKFIHKR